VFPILTFDQDNHCIARKSGSFFATNRATQGQSPEKTFAQAGLATVARTVGGVASQHLSGARLDGLEFAEHKALHGVVGAVTGAILNPKDPVRGATGGALGAVVGETLAELQLGVPDLLAKKDALTPEDLPSDAQIKQAHDVAKLGAATMSLALKQDVRTTIHTATTAVEENNNPLMMILRILGKVGQSATKQAGKKATKELAKKTTQKGLDRVKRSTLKGKDSPQNVAQHEQYKSELRQNMEKPHVEDARLRELVEKRLFKPNPNPVGNGSTQAALRHEKLTGELVHGKDHYKKTLDCIKELERWQRSVPNASRNDQHVAEQLLKDLKDALKP